MVTGMTFTEKCRRELQDQPHQLSFTISRVGLETIVADAERYVLASDIIDNYRQIAEYNSRQVGTSDAYVGHRMLEVLERFNAAALASVPPAAEPSQGAEQAMLPAICPDCRGERRIKGRLCSRCGGAAQIARSALRPGEQAPFEQEAK